MSSLDIGFETIGNATLICYDQGPVLVTDPWVCGSSPYFGSWTLGWEIPQAQLDAIAQCPYVWVSHGHPDHLDIRSLRALKDKKILLPDHVNGRISASLQSLGFDVTVLKDRVWTRLSDRIQIACVADYNQDAVLLVEMDGCLIANLNDATEKGWGRFVAQSLSKAKVSFLMGLTGFGDADMINFFDEQGNRIAPPAAKKMPVGPRVAALTQRYGARYFIPFSSMHAYQRTDSLWANAYTTALEDHAVGFDSKTSQILPAYIRYDCAQDKVEKLNPIKTEWVVHKPEEFKDHWSETLSQEEFQLADRYFKAIFHLTTFLDFITLKVGGQERTIELAKRKFQRGITFEAPRHSLMSAVKQEIFDDLLIGNFMKTTLHGKWPNTRLYPDFSPYVAKYADNGRSKSQKELTDYFHAYRNRSPFDAIRHRLEESGKEVLRAAVPADSQLYQGIKKIYLRLHQR